MKKLLVPMDNKTIATLISENQRLSAENERLREGLERARLDFRGVSGFIYTGPSDHHMRTAAALVETAVDRIRTALQEQDDG